MPDDAYTAWMTGTTAIEFDSFDALTFDCFGTLIDWEQGIIETLAPVIARDGAAVDRDRVLEVYARNEAALEAGEYLPYREVVSRAMTAVCSELGVDVDDDQRARFGGSVGGWPPFADSAEALQRLTARFRLGVITNCDDDLFALSERQLGIRFDWVVSAQQARAYKPSDRPFRLALERLDVPAERILHVAQSLYHDHVVANRLGLSSVWIDRRRGKQGSGATPPAEAKPDATYPDMRSFADAAA
jgi:2-haloacid dehalogenase